MARTRRQLENLSKEELIDELISVEDISSKLSDLTSRFNDFLRRYEILNSELTVNKKCNRLLTERTAVGEECGSQCSISSLSVTGDKSCSCVYW